MKVLGDLSISFWNVGGFTTDKFYDDKFRAHLKSDIICLVETFQKENSVETLSGYVADYSIRNKSSKSKEGTKSSGGILVYIKSKISQGTQIIKSEHNDLLWIKLSKNFFNIESDIYIAVCYIVPNNSSYNSSDTFDVLEREIHKYSALGKVILGGDFNSRLGCKFKDYLISDSSHYLPIDQSLNLDEVFFRNSQDKNHNTSGKHLSEICVTHDLKVLNERTVGDMTGKITCFKYNGCSIVDYIVVQTDIIERVQYFRVNPLTPWPDHCQMTAIFNLTFSLDLSKSLNQ